MKLTILLAALLLLFAVPAMAQVDVTLEWDAGTCEGTAENPVQFRLYDCSDGNLTICNRHETGTAKTFGPISLAHASTTYFYSTCWNYQLIVDDVPQTVEQEGGKSNVLQVKAFSPPGNPNNQRIRITQVGQIDSGLGLWARIGNPN